MAYHVIPNKHTPTLSDTKLRHITPRGIWVSIRHRLTPATRHTCSVDCARSTTSPCDAASLSMCRTWGRHHDGLSVGESGSA